MRGKTISQWLSFLAKLGLISAVAVFLSIVLFTLANYSESSEKLIFYIKINDSVKTKAELTRLHYFYDLSKKWKIQWLADRYLFKDAPFYETADSYLIRNWGKVVHDLKNEQDDPRAYPYGNAKFRQAQAKYQEGETKEALNTVLNEVASDFEKSLINCLSVSVSYAQCFDRVWNYDLVTNSKDAEEALKNKGTQPKYILGPIQDKDAPPLLPSDKDKKKGDREGEGEGGQGWPRKRP